MAPLGRPVDPDVKRMYASGFAVSVLGLTIDDVFEVLDASRSRVPCSPNIAICVGKEFHTRSKSLVDIQSDTVEVSIMYFRRNDGSDCDSITKCRPADRHANVVRTSFDDGTRRMPIEL